MNIIKNYCPTKAPFFEMILISRIKFSDHDNHECPLCIIVVKCQQVTHACVTHTSKLFGFAHLVVVYSIVVFPDPLNTHVVD